MSDLFTSLSIAARALAAQQTGLDVVGQNIANVNTAGYARRQVNLAAVPPRDRFSAGGGVEVTSITSTRDALLERRLRLETPAEGREAALADSLSVVESALGDAGSSIDGNLTEFFDAWSTLAEDPTSATARQGVLIKGQALARGFNDMADGLESARRDADGNVRGLVDQIDELARQIASLNAAIGRSGGGSMALSFKDQQAEAIKQLSELIDVDAIENSTGGVDLSIANGRALVIGANAYSIDVTSDARGFAQLSSGGMQVTSEITGGRLGGMLHARDVVIPDYQDSLDGLAFALASQVNTQHAAGYDHSGTQGGAFFTPLASQAGAAAALQLDPTLAVDPGLVAAAGTSTGADNGNARALAELRNARVLDGGTATLTDGWARLTYRVGQDSSTAQAEQKNRQEIVSQIDALRESVSGVSLDEEAMMMMKFQRAYEANARYFTTVDTAIDTLMQMVVTG
jgi:flagellar hook-associated protein 1 FlgK